MVAITPILGYVFLLSCVTQDDMRQNVQLLLHVETRFARQEMVGRISRCGQRGGIVSTLR